MKPFVILIILFFILLINYSYQVTAQDFCLKFDIEESDSATGKKVYCDNTYSYTKTLALFQDSTFEYTFDRCGSCDFTWGHWKLENDSVIILQGDYLVTDSLLKERRKIIEWYNYRRTWPINNKKLFFINNNVYDLNLEAPQHLTNLILNAEKVSYELDKTKKGIVQCEIKIEGIKSDSIFSPGEGLIQSVNYEKDVAIVFIKLGRVFYIFYHNFFLVNVQAKEPIKANDLIGVILKNIKITILAHKDDIGFNMVLKLLRDIEDSQKN